MEWAVPEFSRTRITKAGRSLLHSSSVQEFEQALAIVNNWRSSHAYPLNTFQITLRSKARKLDENALVAQRIKRLSSIALKLERFPTMTLAQMQDLGGCRAIVNGVHSVVGLRKLYTESRFEHVLHTEDDYIAKPQKSGYRGIHLIYQYRNDDKPKYRDLKIEVQLRSRLQHVWATAVETVGTFTSQALKSSQGQRVWLRFFALMGTAIARLERTAALVPNTPTKSRELVRELRALADELDVTRRLNTYGSALTTVTVGARDARYFLLELDPAEQSTRITGYKARELEQAELDYLRVESARAKDSRRDAVLVSVGSITALKSAYPNYFLDTKLFVALVERTLKGHI